MKNLVKLSEYAKGVGRRRETIYSMVNKGRFHSAEQVGRYWYLDPNEPYPNRKQEGAPAGKVPLKKYAEIYNRNVTMCYKKLNKGRFHSAEQVGRYWYLDPNEPYPSPCLREVPAGKVTIKEYAELNGRSVAACYQQLKKGRFNSAEQVDWYWYLDPNEPYPKRKQVKATCPYPNRKQEGAPAGKVPLKKYAEINNRNVTMCYKKLNEGRFHSAEQVGRYWYLDPNEPYPKRKQVKKGAPADKVSVKKYAELNGRSVAACYKKLNKGRFHSAEQVGRYWYLDPNEPYPSPCLREVPVGKVSVKKYAEINDRSVTECYQKLNEGRFHSAEQVGRYWYLDPNEPYPRKAPAGKVPLKKYAEINNRSDTACYKKLKKGRFQSAERVGRYWYLDPNEPYPSSFPGLKEVPVGKVPLKKYAELNGRSVTTSSYHLKKGRFRNAEYVNGNWYLDPNEPYPSSSPGSRKKAPSGKVPLIKYAFKNNESIPVCYNHLKQDRFRSAEYVNGRWYLDPNEPWPTQKKQVVKK